MSPYGRGPGIELKLGRGLQAAASSYQQNARKARRECTRKEKGKVESGNAKIGEGRRANVRAEENA